MEQVLSTLIGFTRGAHPFVIHLVGINVLAFMLFAIDHAVARHNQDENTGLMDRRALTLFAVAGGASEMLLALILFTGNRINKYNIAWWFSAIVFLVIWGGRRACLGRHLQSQSGPEHFIQHIYSNCARLIPPCRQRRYVRCLLPGQEEGD